MYSCIYGLHLITFLNDIPLPAHFLMCGPVQPLTNLAAVVHKTTWLACPIVAVGLVSHLWKVSRPFQEQEPLCQLVDGHLLAADTADATLLSTPGAPATGIVLCQTFGLGSGQSFVEEYREGEELRIGHVLAIFGESIRKRVPPHEPGIHISGRFCYVRMTVTVECLHASVVCVSCVLTRSYTPTRRILKRVRPSWSQKRCSLLWSTNS